MSEYLRYGALARICQEPSFDELDEWMRLDLILQVLSVEPISSSSFKLLLSDGRYSCVWPARWRGEKLSEAGLHQFSLIKIKEMHISRMKEEVLFFEVIKPGSQVGNLGYPQLITPNVSLPLLEPCHITNTGASGPEASPSIMRLSQDIGNIFTNGKFTDCSITCEGKEFRCHKSILAARSSVFDAMFSHNLKEKMDSSVEIVDLDSETVKDMITYIYSGKVGELDGKAKELLSAAEKYDLADLKQLCEDSLGNNISKDNALELLVLSDLYGACSVRSLALKFIVENGKEIVSQHGWRDKLKMYPEIMADLFEAAMTMKC